MQQCSLNIGNNIAEQQRYLSVSDLNVLIFIILDANF